MAKHINIRVAGRVQGVYFRASAKDQASSLRLKGFVRNEPDGNVYIEAEGDDLVLDKFVAWCKVGPPGADVADVHVTAGDLVGFERFEITR